MNISEIAEMAGVSRAAVSRYLNQGYLSDEKSQRIKKVIDATGYVPSTQAQTLRTKKTRMVGVIVPKINSEAVSRIMDGITRVIEESGSQVLLANTANRVEKELEYLGVFNNKQVDGVILIATIFTKEHHEILSKMKIPVVLVGQRLEGYHCVYHDDYGSIKEVTRALIRKGRRHLGFIGVDERDIAAGFERKRGFQDALAEADMAVNQGRIACGAFDMDNGYMHMKNFNEHHPEIDAVICATDRIAVGALLYLREQGIEVPAQISVTGVGDTGISKVVLPRLTTVHLYYKTSGMEAAQMLMEQIQEENRQARELKLGYKIISRDSV